MWSLALFLAFSSFVVSQIQIVPLTLGQQRRDLVNEFKWKFYSFTAAGGSGFTMTVIHDDEYDLDLYIRKGAQVPDRFSNYDYKDSGMDSNLTIVGRVESVATLYTAGVFCFRGNNVNFSIIVTSGNGCLNSCSGHGACVRGACVCNEGYSGETCNIRSQVLVPGGNELGPFALATGQWTYFRFSVQTTESLQIAVTQTTRGDIDTYVQYGSLPSLTSYRFANLESYDPLHPTHLINMTSPDIGEWIVGCYAFEAASFRIKLIAQRGCPDNCSGAVHGTCVGARCSCSRNYFGTFCESYRPNIMLGQNYTGEVGRGAWNYYKISAGSLNQLVIQMSHLTNEDCDLYVNEYSNPTKTNYTYRDISSATNAKITIPQAGNTLHYVGVFGYRGCHYALSAKLDSPNSTCTNNCVHGTCINGVCQCQSGYSGVRCDQTDTTLGNGVTTQGTVSLGKWSYFNYTFRDTSQVFMIVKELQSQGMMHMYFAFNQPPTLSTYIMKEIGVSNMHRVAVQFSQRTRDFITNNSLTFIVGIYGTTSIPGGRSLPFKIVCWSPPF